MFLRRVLRVLGGMNVVPVRNVRVVGGFLMVSRFVMLRSFTMVVCRVFVMFRCLVVLFFGHGILVGWVAPSRDELAMSGNVPTIQPPEMK